MPAISNASLQRAYERLARVYDVVFGSLLQPGRARAVRSIPSTPGLRVLEVGIGTGLTASCYSRDWMVTGVDLSAPMLEQARSRIASLGVSDNVRLVLADAARLPFDDESFDVVLAPYVMSVVPDAVAAGREMRRVCKESGQIVILNHFLSEDRIGARLERWVSPLATLIGFRTDLALRPLLKAAGLRVIGVNKVNRPRIWTLATCVRDE